MGQRSRSQPRRKIGGLQPEDRFDRRSVAGKRVGIRPGRVVRRDPGEAPTPEPAARGTGVPLRLVGLGQEVLDSRLTFGPPLHLEPLTHRIDAPGLGRGRSPENNPIFAHSYRPF